jgi:hypothetical protein
MSQPISSCVIIKAALGDQKAFDWLVDAMVYNRSQMMFTIFPCECDPPCPRLTKEQEIDINRRVDDAVDAKIKAAQEAYLKKYPDRRIGPGNFAKWIFPAIKNMPEINLDEVFGAKKQQKQ